MATYKDELISAIKALGQDEKTMVIGYNTTAHGGNGGGTFKEFPQDRIQEMPLAENLMAGAAIGLSLEGWIPIVWFERSDFLVHAMDAIVNHLDKIMRLSQGLHRPAAILRVVVGNSNVPLFTGITHTQNLSYALGKMVSFPVRRLERSRDIAHEYGAALDRAKRGESTALCEYKDFYDRTDV